MTGVAERAHAAFDRRAWQEAYALLAEADARDWPTRRRSNGSRSRRTASAT